MKPKFFGNSLFGGEFFIKDFPLSDENPDPNILKLSFQGIGNNLVITGRTHDGKTLTVFGVADTTSVSFEVNNQDGIYKIEKENKTSENLTWEWEENTLNIFVSTYGFLKAVIYDNEGKEVVYPIKQEENKIIVVFPKLLSEGEKNTLKLMYSYNGLDVASSLGDVALRNVGVDPGHIPEVGKNGKIDWSIVPFVGKVDEIRNPDKNHLINLKNGDFQIFHLNQNVYFQITSESNFKNGEKLILQIKNNGHRIYVNGVEIDCFYGVYNLVIVKINDVYQYWGKQEVKEIR